MNIDGMRVLITGASSGLGEALAWELGRQGAVCTLAARRLHRLEELAERIHAAFPGRKPPFALACDVTDGVGLPAAVEVAARHMGGIDLFINNAGVSAYGETERMNDEDLTKVMTVNFQGAVHGMVAALRVMRRQGGGRIVNIASLAALHGVPYLAAYGASKAALATFSQSLRAEIASEGISIQMIYPGYIQTRIFSKELKLGGARRPDPPYTPVESMARRIVKAMKNGKPEVALGPQGKLMAFLRGTMPRVLDRIMRRMAHRLRDNEEHCHA